MTNYHFCAISTDGLSLLVGCHIMCIKGTDDRHIYVFCHIFVTKICDNTHKKIWKYFLGTRISPGFKNTTVTTTYLLCIRLVLGCVLLSIAIDFRGYFPETLGAHQLNTYRMMYVPMWRTVNALTRVLYWCLFPELRSNEGNKHQNNTRVSA